MSIHFLEQFEVVSLSVDRNLDQQGNRKSQMCAARGLLQRLWGEDDAQEIAEYAVMTAIILVILVGTIRLISGR